MVAKPISLYKLSETEAPVNITLELKEKYDSLKEVLSDVFKLALKQPNPAELFVIMTDAGFRNAGFAPTIEDNSDQKIQ